MAATGTPTPNIGLRIPVGTDPASVDDINYNSNLIDTKLGAVGSDSVQDQIDALNSKITPASNSITYKNSVTDRNGRTRLINIGNLCVLNISVNASSIPITETEIMTISSSLAPSQLTFGTGVTNERGLITLNIDATGSVKVIGQNNHAIANGTLVWVAGK